MNLVHSSAGPDHDPDKCDACRQVWAWLESEPDFAERMAQAEKDMEAGRFYTFDPETGDSHPNPNWPKDGPQPRHD